MNTKSWRKAVLWELLRWKHPSLSLLQPSNVLLDLPICQTPWASPLARIPGDAIHRPASQGTDADRGPRIGLGNKQENPLSIPYPFFHWVCVSIAKNLSNTGDINPLSLRCMQTISSVHHCLLTLV